MKRISYLSYFSEKAEGILLATFEFEWEEYEHKKIGLFRKTTEKKIRREKYCLVFTPYKHRMKDLEVISYEDVLSELQFDESLRIVESERFISNNNDNPYDECTVINFKGCDFILENKDFICNAYNADKYAALELLYKIIPNIIDEVFDDEQ